MEFKVGDRVEITKDTSSYNTKGEQGVLISYDGQPVVEFDNPVGNDWKDWGRDVKKQGNYYLWSDGFSFKLIEKGDNRMEETKQIKGLKVKIGSKIYDTNYSNLGIVIAGTPEHCIYKDLNDNKEHVSSWNNIKLEIEKPNKLLLPKEEKVKKKTK
jgi:hypothetical protein